jgi:hypothetical protein
MDKAVLEEALERAKGLTFETVWLAILETQASVKETQVSIKKTEKSVSELSKNIGGVNNKIGKLTEALFSPALKAKFKKLGYYFDSTSSNVEFEEDGQFVAEVDVFLEDTTHAMAVEIKTTLTVQDVDEHIDRLAKIKRWMAKRKKTTKLLGAVAGAIADKSVIAYAHKKGLFVLVLSGESVKIAKTPPKFAPREW